MRDPTDEAMLRVDEAFHDGRRWLDLRNLGLQVLPPRLADLTALTTLDLSDNQLTALRALLPAR